MQNKIVLCLQKNIKKYREKKNLTQLKLSILTGISADYISEIERGKRTPSLKRLILISEALNIDIKDLFSDD